MGKRGIIDLFAGAGGLTLGFTQNNFDILDTIEFWQPAVDTYNFNFKKNVVAKDITDSEVRNELRVIEKIRLIWSLVVSLAKDFL